MDPYYKIFWILVAFWIAAFVVSFIILMSIFVW